MGVGRRELTPPGITLGVPWRDAVLQDGAWRAGAAPAPRWQQKSLGKPLPFHQGIVGFFREGWGGLGTPRTLVSCMGPGTQGGSGAVGTAAQFPSIN